MSEYNIRSLVHRYKNDTLEERYNRLVIKNSTGCYGWKGSVDSDGYARFTLHYIYYKAHRVSYELYKGPIPEGLDVLHHCDNPPCSKPECLFVGTSLDNVQDKIVKDRGAHVYGSKHWNSVLTEKQVLEIRKLYIPFIYSQSKLAKQFNVCQQTIMDIVSRRTWTHI